MDVWNVVRILHQHFYDAHTHMHTHTHAHTQTQHTHTHICTHTHTHTHTHALTVIDRRSRISLRPGCWRQPSRMRPHHHWTPAAER